MLTAILSGLLPVLGTVLDRVIPDPEQARRARAEMSEILLAGELKELEAAANIILAEANGESWLQRNWRPILMMTFGFIIANNYIIAPYMEALFGFSVVLEIPPAMWELLKLGIGGYILGRSGEKAAKLWRGPAS